MSGGRASAPPGVCLKMRKCQSSASVFFYYLSISVSILYLRAQSQCYLRRVLWAYDVKLRNARKLISEGNRVKFSLRFKGREMEHSNLGIAMLLRLKQDLIEVIRVEMEPKIEGRQAFLVVAPK